jgi:hypothetical protein
MARCLRLTRWLFEQYDFLRSGLPGGSTGDLKSRSMSSCHRRRDSTRNAGGRGGGGFGGPPDPATIPVEYQKMLGRISDE